MPKKKVAKKVAKKTKKKRKKKVAKKSGSTRTSVSSAPKKASKSGDAIDAWMDKMAKDRKWKGKVQIRRASDVATPYIVRRPTGLLSLDLALGGGIHAGGVCEIQSEEGAGKTFLAYMTAGQIQRTYGEDTKILIACSEGVPDTGFARQAGFCIGYDEERINFYDQERIENGYEPFTDEEREDLSLTIGRVIIQFAETGEPLLDAVIEALDASRDDPTGGFQMILIDSLGALQPSAAEEKDIVERTFGGSAPMMTKFQNKVYPRLVFDRSDGTKQLTSIVGISQARANTDRATKYDPATKSSTGAFAWKHGQLARIELAQGRRERVDGEVIGKVIRWKLGKGKAGTRDGKKGEATFYHLDKREPIFWRDVTEAEEVLGFDTVTDAVTVAKKMGIIDGSTWLTWMDGRKTILKAQGLAQFATALMDEPELLVYLREQVMRESGIMVKYR